MENIDLMKLIDNYDTQNAALSCSQMPEFSNFKEVDRLDKEIDILKSKLQECRKECEDKEVELCNVRQLKDKGLFVLKNVEEKYKNLDEELNYIHNNYIKCVAKVNSYEENVNRKIKSLARQRDNLKQELEELKKTVDDNNKKLLEMKNLIITQEKKNMALLRKLRKQVERKYITEELRDRINTILNDPRITTPNFPN